MRNAFADELLKLATEDQRVVMLSADIGNRLFDGFKDRFANRFFNCGVAEANLISVGAGMASCGMRPIAYTITPFITTRCYEQIRVDLCYHEQPVVIVGVGAGLSYAANGATHHSCEDIAILRALPEMVVVCPGDAVEVRLALRAALKQDRPLYLRMGKKGEPVVHQTPPKFEIGRAIPVREGEDVALLSTGNMLPAAVEAGELLGDRGLSAEVVSFHTVKPLDEDYLAEAFGRFSHVVTIEEHSRLGGFGSAVAEWLSDQAPQKARLLRVGSGDRFLHEAGGQDYARQVFGLTPEAIADQVEKLPRLSAVK